MRFFYLISFFFFVLTNSFAQRSEVGFMLGGSVYSGDLSPDLINYKFISPAIGALYRYNFDPHWAAKASIFYGSVFADDKESSEAFQRNRNLSFQSYIIELSGQVEFNFFEYEIGDRKRPFTPFIFTGLSLFDFNPVAEYNGDKYDLQALGTEGQNLASATKDEYSLVQLSIPLGLGLKWNVGQKFSLGFEIGARKTFTDYLDDVSGEYADKNLLLAEHGPAAAALSDRSLNKSIEKGRQRGTSLSTDWYTFAGVTLSLSIGKTTKVSCDPFKK